MTYYINDLIFSMPQNINTSCALPFNQLFLNQGMAGMPIWNFSNYNTDFPIMNGFNFFNFNYQFQPFTPTVFNNVTNSDHTAAVTVTSSNVSAVRQSILSEADKYIGKWNKNDAMRKFSRAGVHGGGWCIDFITYCAKQALPNYPEEMWTCGPGVLREQAKKRNCYKQAPSSNRAEWAMQNIKPGDMLIADGDGQSGLHGVIVKEVCMEGNDCKIKVYSGNDAGGVVETAYYATKGRTYRGRAHNVLGVVNIDQFA